MRQRLKLLALLAATPFVAVPASAQRALRIDSSLTVYLQQLADTGHLETARCIVGRYSANGDTLYLSGALDAPWLIQARSPGSVMWYPENCPHSVTVAQWHAHVGVGAACALSVADAGILLDETTPPFSIITAAGDKRPCIFYRVGGDIRQISWAADSTRAPPP